MITYVNSVLVSNKAATLVANPDELAQDKDIASPEAGNFIIENLDADVTKANKYKIDDDTQRIRIGLVTNKNTVVRKRENNKIVIKYQPIIRWTNDIKKHDIKSFSELVAPADMSKADAEDKVTIDFSKLNTNIESLLGQGGKRVIVRITYKDLPTRYRKWTESYEYVTNVDDNRDDIIDGLVEQINSQWKRARVIAAPGEDGDTLELTAMKYTDDDDFDTINRANKVRFNVNMYFTDPAAEGWESLNKHYLQGVKITKTPAKQYPAIGKLVRDRENQSYGYMGILNRGCCTWPIIQPERIAKDDAIYNALTLEFENMYRAADDIFRKTKQTVEIYTSDSIDALKTALKPFAGDPVKQDGEKGNDYAEEDIKNADAQAGA